MDIFTTQLTRVVPVPIKPDKLKVKALVKESASGKVAKEKDPFSVRAYYIRKKDIITKKQEHEPFDEENSARGKHAKETQDKQKGEQIIEGNEDLGENQSKVSDENDDEPPHIDVYA